MTRKLMMMVAATIVLMQVVGAVTLTIDREGTYGPFSLSFSGEYGGVGRRNFYDISIPQGFMARIAVKSEMFFRNCTRCSSSVDMMDIESGLYVNGIVTRSYDHFDNKTIDDCLLSNGNPYRLVVSLSAQAGSDSTKMEWSSILGRYVPRPVIEYGNGTLTYSISVAFSQADHNVKEVSFDTNGGSGSFEKRILVEGSAVGRLPVPERSGYIFEGWYTKASGGSKVTPETRVTAYVIYYAHWTKTNDSAEVVVDPDCAYDIAISFSAGGGTGTMATIAKTADVCNESTYYTLPACAFRRTGYVFAGWRVKDACLAYADDSSIPVYAAGYSYGPLCGNLNLTATWKAQVPSPESSSSIAHNLYNDVDGAAPASAASEYNGYLYDEKSGAVKGTIQVKVGKPGKKDGKAMVKATVVVGAKKIALKGAEMGKAVIATDEPTEIDLVGKGAEECSVMLGAYGITGYYGAYVIDGARNIFSSKDKDDLADAKDALDKCLGSRMVIWDGGSVSVSIASKGKVKVSGTLASGAKVSATAVLLVGEEWNCVSVAAPKTNLSFVLWLSRDGKTTMVDGLGDDVLVGNAGTLADGAVFSVPADAALWSAIPGEVRTEYLPNGVPVTKKGTMWTLPKVGRIKMKKGVIDVSKAGENPSGLKLTYKAKDGTFKGSFKVYAVNKGKLKATTVNVTGFLLNGIGFGTATIKKVGSVSVRIE